MTYAYDHLRREILDEDASFRSGPAPGEELPDFELPDDRGGTVRKEDFAGRPLLVLLSSFT